MFNDCPRFTAFREQLDAAGVTMRPTWSCKRNPGLKSRYDDTAHFLLLNSVGGRKLAVVECVVLSHGKDGFSIYFGSDTADMAKYVATIVGAPPAEAAVDVAAIAPDATRRFALALDLSNDAFQDRPGDTVAGMLEAVAANLRKGFSSQKMYDANGNGVGRWQMGAG